MFPVPKELIEKIDNAKMDTYRDFDSEIEKSIKNLQQRKFEITVHFKGAHLFSFNKSLSRPGTVFSNTI